MSVAAIVEVLMQYDIGVSVTADVIRARIETTEELQKALALINFDELTPKTKKMVTRLKNEFGLKRKEALAKMNRNKKGGER